MEVALQGFSLTLPGAKNMNSKTPLNYVRTYRRRWALTQVELAALIGIESRTGISRIEQGERLPSLEAALALEVLFGMAPRMMFPLVYAETEEAVMMHAASLHEGTVHSTNPREKRKSALLEDALGRAIQSGKRTHV
jgi:DNA-binding XRE family transcriptional regulator